MALIDKYHPFNFRYFKFLITIMMIILLGMVLILGWLFSIRKITEIVTNDFNQQQLLLAKHAASQIENSIDLLKRELTLLTLSPAIQYSEKPALKNRMNITFSSVKHEGVREIKFIENKAKRVFRIIEGKNVLKINLIKTTRNF